MTMGIEVKGISKFYGTQQALKEISFEINTGEIVGFLGPNGAGKSTTMKILTGYLPASEGIAKINGLDITTDKLKLQQQIGYLPEHNPLYLEMYVREYLAFNAKVYKTLKEEIEKVFKEIAEERQSRKITRLICSKRVESPIKTTKDLVNIVLSSRSGTSKIHTLRNIFRAIRMKVNCELEELSGVLKAAGTVLKVGGRLLVISFHSLEDRTTKRFIQGKDGAGIESTFKLVGGKPLKPDQLEIDNNPRSRSAILRIAEKVI